MCVSQTSFQHLFWQLTALCFGKSGEINADRCVRFTEMNLEWTKTNVCNACFCSFVVVDASEWSQVKEYMKYDFWHWKLIGRLFKEIKTPVTITFAKLMFICRCGTNLINNFFLFYFECCSIISSWKAAEFFLMRFIIEATSKQKSSWVCILLHANILNEISSIGWCELLSSVNVKPEHWS